MRPNRDMDNQEPLSLETWRRKLAHLQQEEAKNANPALKFEIQAGIEECLQKIAELEAYRSPKSRENPVTESEGARKYRERVKKALENHSLTGEERIFLEKSGKRFGFSEAEVKRIIAEEESPILRARQDYQEFLEALIEGDYYPFGEKTEQLLQEHRSDLNLLPWEVEKISKPILEKAETDFRRRVVITVDRSGTVIKCEKKQFEYFEEPLGNGIVLLMTPIPGGQFWMGTEDAEIERLTKKYNGDWFKRESPRHLVTVSPFSMSKYPITQEQWKFIASRDKIEIELPPNPSYFKENKNPVERVNWFMAVEFCKRLSKLTGKKYRLPSEAEWEYACRAGTETPFHYGETITTDLANYDGNYTYAEEKTGVYREKTTEVGQFPPNPFGLHDTHGNVWEWCEDDWHENYQGAPNDGNAWIDDNDNRSQKFKCLRGGSWSYGPGYCRSAYRYGSLPVTTSTLSVFGWSVRAQDSSPLPFNPFPLFPFLFSLLYRR